MKILMTALILTQTAAASEFYSGIVEMGFDPETKEPITKSLAAKYEAVGGNTPGYALKLDGGDSGTLWRNGDRLEGFARNSSVYLSYLLDLHPDQELLSKATCEAEPTKVGRENPRAVLQAVRLDLKTVDYFCVRLTP